MALLSSLHILSVFRPLWLTHKAATTAIDESQRPKGLLALVVTGVHYILGDDCSNADHTSQLERAFRMYRTGRKSPDVLGFSFENYGTIIAGYMKSIEELSDKRWQYLLVGNFVSHNVKPTIKPDAEIEELDALRGSLYDASRSSPVPEDFEE